MNKNFKNRLRQMFCEHEWDVKCPSPRFRVYGRTIVQPWVCRCRKCGVVKEIIHGGE